jgi:hypothetical protein
MSTDLGGNIFPINLSTRFADFATVVKDATQSAGNVVITAANHDKLTLDGMTLAALKLDSTDFKFA